MTYRLLLACLLSFPVFSQPQLLDSLNTKGYGTFSGRAQSLYMTRIYNGAFEGDEYALSVGFTANYLSPEFKGLQLGAQYFGSFVPVDGGNAAADPARSLSMGATSILTHLYLNYNFKGINNLPSQLTIGRQGISNRFSTTFEVRQKEQAFEAITLDLPISNKWHASAGFIHRFSAWRHRNKFEELHVVEESANRSPGMFFSELTYLSGKKWKGGKAQLHYNHAPNLYQTADLTLSQKCKVDSNVWITPQLRGVWQQSLPGYLWEPDTNTSISIIKSSGIQGSVKVSDLSKSLELGVMAMSGDGLNPEHDFLAPFQPNLAIKEPLYEIDLGVLGGSFSMFALGSYEHKNHFFYVVGMHSSNRDLGILLREADLIYKIKFKRGLHAAFKGAYAYYTFDNSEAISIIDLRFFLGINL